MKVRMKYMYPEQGTRNGRVYPPKVLKKAFEESVDKPIVPETLTQCRCHYNPPVKEHIHCPDFGKSDGINGSCWWCMEMTPYQWHMCSDETWIRGLINPYGKPAWGKCLTRDEAVQFIEDYKQRHFMSNEPEAGKFNSDEKTAKWEFWPGWIGNFNLRIDDATCSECGYVHPMVYRPCGSKETPQDVLNKLSNICPGCGAKMDLEGTE